MSGTGDMPYKATIQYDDGPVYVDKTGTANKPDPMRDVYLEFPRAMLAVAMVTKYGATKHAPRGWQTFDPELGMRYHRSKMGRHLINEELDGPVNHGDGGLLHAAQAVWNMLAYLENYLKGEEARAEVLENEISSLQSDLEAAIS